MSTPDWAAMAAGLPRHETEVMSAHGGQPSVAEQDRTHGAGIPAVDNGMTESEKYGGVGGDLPAAC